MNNAPDNRIYVAYSLSISDAEARAAFRARFGVEPERAQRVVITHWPGEHEWGYWWVGPVPDQTNRPD